MLLLQCCCCNAAAGMLLQCCGDAESADPFGLLLYRYFGPPKPKPKAKPVAAKKEAPKPKPKKPLSRLEKLRLIAKERAAERRAQTSP